MISSISGKDRRKTIIKYGYERLRAGKREVYLGIVIA